MVSGTAWAVVRMAAVDAHRVAEAPVRREQRARPRAHRATLEATSIIPRHLPMPSLSALAQALTEAHHTGRALDARPWAETVRNEADAYAVQDAVAAALGWAGTRWKSGGAGPQGPFSHSPVNPGDLPDRPLLGVEVEVALRLARDLTPADAQRPLAAADVVDAMCIAVECVASRWQQGLDAPALLRMADFQSNAGLLLGPWQPWRALDWAHLDWRLALPGQPDTSRRGGHALADPAGVLPAWLQHLTREGQTVRAGTVVTTGAWSGLHGLAAAPGLLRLTMAGLGELAISLPASAGSGACPAA
ncbi:MAG: 2-keto-4-pentenoate hydratase [Roseateles sp.]|nr:MAG: 2-keto-4-pentenoate hydratase [Roseateles sp.]